ncbi:hypothetical protein [Paenibacillus aceti]|uniref:Uncharacterized protein n=1 Tax=Paenibacillus aceti TaxID=1820010 RepID=A0ABQ1VPM5_9BACL|nr:hypothetical protein [Paenibacillus aceti]GGF86887.1 hypothetical protein GCM10010913_05470 [Paenibacillus aceti]
MVGEAKQVRDKKEPTELERLINEKITLSKKLGIMGDLEPIKGYKETEEYKRIQVIDKQLWELVK